MGLPGVDVVIPAHNEAAMLPATLASLRDQVDGEGRRLPPGAVRVLVVDNESTDGTAEVAARFAARYPELDVAVLREEVKSPVQARIRGAEFAIRTGGDRPILASADADTRYHPQWLFTAIRSLGGGALDALSFAGGFSVDFWGQVPRLALRYYSEAGSILFDPATLSHLGLPPGGPLTWRVLRDLPKLPSDCAFALTKDAYARAGGFRRERHPDGREILGEGWNLRFRLDRAGARVACSLDVPYATSARRLVFEADAWLSRRSYENGMSDHRGEVTARALAELDRRADEFDFEPVLRYLVRHCLLLPALGRPELVPSNPSYFGPVAEELHLDLSRCPAARGMGTSSEIHAWAQALSARYHDRLLRHLREAAGWDGGRHPARSSVSPAK
jgi:glycosyltransferase involved in cell wall biosynthesis